MDTGLGEEDEVIAAVGEKKCPAIVRQQYYNTHLKDDIFKEEGAAMNFISLYLSQTECKQLKRVTLDIVGPLPKSHNGYQYILVLVDYATRFPEAVPLRSITAPKVAKELLKWIARAQQGREEGPPGLAEEPVGVDNKLAK
ncbi:hypothetical protein Y1Q_0009115 [Alligator mississippiensis]|uniref:Integrase catalytic domain-containing protein n=1 Tax=Alligator mississippiensis TaxID=8496 RepID=A0A151M2A3_ALLMI|nr:hypothetical protein Y1Q_0009115 [Alligator mississippiensis]